MKTKISLSKQMLSIFLCMVMLLSYVPMTVFAAEDAVEVSTEAELIAALANGGNIILTDDITLSEENQNGLYVEKDTTINLNGYALTGGRHVLDVYSDCTLTVVGDGTISNANPIVGFAISAADGGKVKILSSNVSGIDVAMGASVDVSGGTIETLYVMENSVATVSGGVVEDMHVMNAIATVSGGTFGFDPSEYLAEGYTTTIVCDDYMWWIVICAGGCEYTYTVNDDGTHTISCDKCNYEVTEVHTFVNGVCACGEPCPHTSIVDSVRYTVSQNRIVENCTVCSNHTATADLVIDDTVSTVYTGSDIKALKVVYSDNWLGGDLEIIYSNNINAGDASGKISKDGVTAENTFKIEPKEISISWGATMFLPYNGASKVPEAYANGLLEGDACTLTTEVVETTEGAGIIPGTWTAQVTALSNPNYKLPASGERVTASFEIVTGYQNYAPIVSGVDETVDGKGDGKITGVDNTMEYYKEGETTYTAVVGTEITGLQDGVYYVRYAAKTYYNPSPYAKVTIGAGRLLTVTYKADGQVISTQTMEYGKDATAPEIPEKDGYIGKWDRNNENITADTEINAVYTKIADVVPDEFAPEDKTELEDTKKQLEEMLKDDGYTEDDKKDIQDAIDDIDDALEVIGNVENVEDLIDKIPDTVTKDDEAAIKAADDAYNALTDEEKALVDPDAKKALDDAKAALEELKKPVFDPDSPQTGDNTNLWLWFVLLFISGAGIFGITVYDRKRKATSKK